jgi:hypothetical protein
MTQQDKKFEIGSKVRITRGVCFGREGVIEQIEHKAQFVDMYYIRCYKQLNEQWVWKMADAMELVEEVGAIEIPIRTLLSEGDFEQLCTSIAEKVSDKLREQADAKSDEEAHAQELIATLTDIRFKADMTEKIESQAKEIKELRAKVKEQKKEIYRFKEALNAAYREINGLAAMAAQNDKVIDLITSEEYKLPLYRQRETLRYLRYIFDWYNVKLWLNNDKLELVGDGEQKFTLTLTTAPGFGAEDAQRVLEKLEQGKNV